MAERYDGSVDELFQVPHGAFVAERKRLAAALKAAGDKDGAARLAKLARPSISAWAVNQLWWHARDAFEAMLATAATVRAGDLGGAAAHRETLATLRARAASILEDAGHSASESILRRVTTTLSAIAAAGGFDPDRPGTLSEDRDPPGFETMGIGSLPAPAPAPAPAPRARPAPDESAAAARRAEEAAEAQARLDAAAERRRIEEERARRQAERHRVEAALRTATGEVERLGREIERLARAQAETESKLSAARDIVGELEAKLAELAGLT